MSLDAFRAKATICPRKMKLLVEGEDRVNYKEEFTRLLQADPIFKRDYSRPSMQEQRELNHQRWKKLVDLMHGLDPYSEFEKFSAISEVLETYDQGLSARYSLHMNVFGSAIQSMGTKRHEQLLEQTKNNEIIGCFALTELSHGSNTQEAQTTATFDNGEFVFNSPHTASIKAWVGNMAQSATHAVVFAQLFTEGKCHGLHSFVLQIRDLKTHDPLPGIRIGDMGEKPGLWNGVENGWMEFKNHRAPLWTLLNKGCDVTADGKYQSAYKSTSERQSVTLGALSVGRIGIIGKGILGCQLASTIALRYSATRRQFGPNKGEEEVPVLDYPLQQHRLLPYLAAYFALRVFHQKFFEYFGEYMARMLGGEKSEELAEFSKEVHALSSSAKPIATWLGIEALGEARRACGGHGYLFASRLNCLRDDFDPAQTFEGENNILLQQTSNILISKLENGSLDTPMGTMSYLRDKLPVFSGFSSYLISDILNAYKWLVNYLLRETASGLSESKHLGAFEARNNTQVYRAHPLSIAYAEHTVIQWFHEFIKEVDDVKYKKVLEDLCVLYGISRLETHLSTLYIGGFCKGPIFGAGIRHARQDAEARLASECIGLVDSIAPPDFLLNSVLGVGDGRVYEHILEELEKNQKKPDWWKDLVEYLDSRKQQPNSKL